MTDYVIRREEERVCLVIDGTAFAVGGEITIQRGYGGLTRILLPGYRVELQPGDTLRYEGWEETAKPPAPIGSAAEFAASPTRLAYVVAAQHLERADLRRLAFDLYRLEHGGCWEGDFPTAARVNVAVDWWNGDAKENG